RGLSARADNLLVVAVTDQEDRVVARGEPAYLCVHRGDQRACGVDDAKIAAFGFVVYVGCDTVRGQHQYAAGWYVAGLCDGDRPAALQVAYDVEVVHDLAAYVHRRSELVECALDVLDGALDARVERAGTGEQ